MPLADPDAEARAEDQRQIVLYRRRKLVELSLVSEKLFERVMKVQDIKSVESEFGEARLYTEAAYEDISKGLDGKKTCKPTFVMWSNLLWMGLRKVGMAQTFGVLFDEYGTPRDLPSFVDLCDKKQEFWQANGDAILEEMRTKVRNFLADLYKQSDAIEEVAKDALRDPGATLLSGFVGLLATKVNAGCNCDVFRNMTEVSADHDGLQLMVHLWKTVGIRQRVDEVRLKIEAILTSVRKRQDETQVQYFLRLTEAARVAMAHGVPSVNVQGVVRVYLEEALPDVAEDKLWKLHADVQARLDTELFIWDLRLREMAQAQLAKQDAKDEQRKKMAKAIGFTNKISGRQDKEQNAAKKRFCAKCKEGGKSKYVYECHDTDYCKNFPASTKKPKGKCHKCGQSGHWKRECPVGKSPQANTTSPDDTTSRIAALTAQFNAQVQALQAGSTQAAE